MTPDLWLLPGMDGTGRLFARLVRVLAEQQAGRRANVFAYDDRASTYQALLAALPSPTRPTVVMGESFGGPLALELAARHPEHVTHVVLVASFARPPRPMLWLAATLARRAPTPPALAVRAAMLGMDADDALLEEVREAIAATPRETLAARLGCLAGLDATERLRALPARLTVVAATDDRLVPFERAAQPARLARRGELVCLAGPHLLAQRHPRAIAGLLGRILDGDV